MSLNTQTIAFIGGGNMARALIGGLIASGAAPERIRVGEPDDAARDALSRDYGVETENDNARAAQGAEVVVLAVKPQVLAKAAEALAPAVAQDRPLIMSIAAGVTTAVLAKAFAERTPIVRAMPNTPALIGRGAAGLYANATVSPAQRDTAQAIMQAAGEALWIEDEALMDTVTATSGSGPAYFFLVIEAIEAAAAELGLDPLDARRLVLQTALGAAQMAHDGDADVARLRRRVTSPGGTTAAALDVLEKGNLRALFKEALTAARDRGRELSGS